MTRQTEQLLVRTSPGLAAAAVILLAITIKGSCRPENTTAADGRDVKPVDLREVTTTPPFKWVTNRTDVADGAISLASLPPDCRTTAESYLPICNELRGLAVNCGKYGHFCLALYPTETRRTGIVLTSILHRRIRSLQKASGKHVSTFRRASDGECVPEGGRCHIDTTELCDWWPNAKQMAACNGRVTVGQPPNRIGVRGTDREYVYTIIGAWPQWLDQQGRFFYKQMTKNARWWPTLYAGPPTETK
jgi:hypothetical protein